MDFPSAPPRSTLTAGATVSGGQQVDGLTARTSNCTWSKVGEKVEITIQLACFQSDAEKERDNKRFAMHELGYDFYVNQAHSLQAEFHRVKSELARVADYLHGTFDLIPGAYPPANDLIDPEERVDAVKKEEARKDLLPLE